MTNPQTSGADLARQMFRRARADAATRPTAPAKKKPARRRAQTGDRRDPAKFGGILDTLAAEYGWKRPTAGGMLTANWARIAPDLARLCAPERYDADTRTLHLRPMSPAAATKLRWEAPRIAATLNAAVGDGTVANVRVLQPGPGRTASQSSPAAPAQAPPVERQPRTRADGAPGYRLALDAALAARPKPEDAPDQALRDRYFADVRGTLREPEPAHPLPAAEARGTESERARQAALKRARDERAGRTPAVPTAFQRTA